MKEIKEEVKREITDIHTYYEAVDGTRFENQEECRKYDNSALAVMRAKIKPLMSEKKDAWVTMGGYNDDQVVAVSMESERDLDNVIQWLFLECSWYLEDRHKEQKDKVIDIINTAFINKDVLLFGINCNDDYYFINSSGNIISNLNNLTKKENA